MVVMGIGMMLGMGLAVTAAVSFAHNRDEEGRVQVFSALAMSTLLMVLLTLASFRHLDTIARPLGSSAVLAPAVAGYLRWLVPGLIFQLWAIIGLFVIRLDGLPRFAMWCNVVPGLLNVVLDYLFIFPQGMGVAGAAMATFVSFVTGGLMVWVYLLCLGRRLRLSRLNLARAVRHIPRCCYEQCRIGLSVLLGEGALGFMTLMGNLMFARYVGDAGVGAFGVACYYAPFVFMTANAVAQSAQPIISYNMGIAATDSIRLTVRASILTALVCGLVLTGVLVLMPSALVGLFVDTRCLSGLMASAGLPLFALSFVPFIFNITAIGYFQSVKQIKASIALSMLRALIVLAPTYILLPRVLGVDGIWLAQGVSELVVTLIILFSFWFRPSHRPASTDPH